MSSVAFTVVDKYNNPLEGVTVHLNGTNPETGETAQNGTLVLDACNGFNWGCPRVLDYTASASGYQTVTGTVSRPPWDFTQESVTIVMYPQSVSSGPGNTCPFGYTYNSVTGYCDPTITANPFANAATYIQNNLVMLTVLSVVFGGGYLYYRVRKAKGKGSGNSQSDSLLNSLITGLIL